MDSIQKGNRMIKFKKMKHPTQPNQKQQTGYKKTTQNIEQHHGKEII